MYTAIRAKPLLFLAAPLAAGMLCARLSGASSAFYRGLILPPFAPSGAMLVFAWTALYLLMGAAFYLICEAPGLSRADHGSALMLCGCALLTSCLWPFLFFRFRLFLLSAIWCLVVFATAALCAAVFYRIRKAAGLLFAPVCLWLAFFSVLIFAVSALN